MRGSLENLKEQFSDEDYRYGYAESFLNSYVAAQIKILREQRELTQAQLAERIGTKQAGISRLENVNYTAWKVDTLTRLARALGVRLRISFEEFGSLPDDIDHFGRASLQKAAFEDDPVFGNIEREAEPVALTETEKKALASSDSNELQVKVLKFVSNPLAPAVKRLRSEENEDAPDVDKLSKGSGLHGIGGAEPQRQGVSA